MLSDVDEGDHNTSLRMDVKRNDIIFNTFRGLKIDELL